MDAYSTLSIMFYDCNSSLFIWQLMIAFAYNRNMNIMLLDILTGNRPEDCI